MTKKALMLFSVIGLMIMAAWIAVADAETSYDGKVVKMEGLSTLYYVMDGKRYVFPNEKTYQSWFTGFDGVVTLSPEAIYALPLAGNVRYRPGVLLVKITTDPKVYAVSNNGVLRWVKTEQLAKKIYGNDWNLLVDDVPDSFFTNYTVGSEIDDDSDYSADEEAEGTQTIHENNGLHLGWAKKSDTGKCRATPAVPAKPGHKGTPATPATPAIPARDCKKTATTTDTTAPVISTSSISVIAGTSTAIVGWTTDEESTSVVEYASESLATASSTKKSASSSVLTKSHSLTLTDLTATTTYYYLVKSADANGNTAIGLENTFKTSE